VDVALGDGAGARGPKKTRKNGAGHPRTRATVAAVSHLRQESWRAPSPGRGGLEMCPDEGAEGVAGGATGTAEAARSRVQEFSLARSSPSPSTPFAATLSLIASAALRGRTRRLIIACRS
jgi:hypothetical protein